MRFLLVLIAGAFACLSATIAPLSALASEFDPTAPAAFQFGEGMEAHASAFETLCSIADVRELDPSEMPLATETLVQVDCQGFDYFSALRLAEFVFADGILTHVWVLTNSDDEAGLREAFETEFGAPTHEAEIVFAFMDNNAAIRRDIPEALYMSDAAAPLFRAWFDQVVSQGSEQGTVQ